MPNISPVLLREEVARRLRAARVMAGITPAEAAEKLDISRTSLCRIETAQQRATVHLVRTMMDLYDFRDDELLDKVRAARKKGWWKAYGISDQHFIALETGAIREHAFDVQLVPGLLQTADYAQALFESERVRQSQERIADFLEVRLIRQDRLTDEENPLELIAVIDEYVLRRPVGGSSVMRAQLRHLALAAELPTVTLHVLPTRVVTNDSTYGRFDLLDFGSPDQPSIAYVNHAFGDDRSSNPEALHAARLRFEHLRTLALGTGKSVELIEQVSDELWSG